MSKCKTHNVSLIPVKTMRDFQKIGFMPGYFYHDKIPKGVFYCPVGRELYQRSFFKRFLARVLGEDK